MSGVKNRVALVTGAGSANGIGYATANLLRAAGAKVAITSTTERIFLNLLLLILINHTWYATPRISAISLMSSRVALSVISLNSLSRSSRSTLSLPCRTAGGSYSSSESYSPFGLVIWTSSIFGIYWKSINIDTYKGVHLDLYLT